MKVGDLVQPLDSEFVSDTERCWKGIIIRWEGIDPVVFWNTKFPAEVEYKEQIEVVREAG